MGNFVKKILAIGIILASLISAVEFVLLRQPNELSFKREYMEKNGAEVKTLLIGASNAANGIDPAEIGDSCFNMAVNGQMMCITRAVCEKYLPDCTNLETVIMPIAYRQLYEGYAYPLSRTDLVYHMKESEKCKYLKYMGVIENPGDWIYWPETVWLKADTISRLFNNDNTGIGCDTLGFERLSLSNRGENWKQVPIPGEIEDRLGNAELAFQDNVRNVRKIAELCQSKGARLILLATPYFETAQKATDERRRAVLREFVGEVEKGYDNVLFREYTFDTRFQEDDFYNSSHLNEFGAAKFAAILRDDFNL